MPGHATGAARLSRPSWQGPATRASEPGFLGTFLYRNDNFRTGQNLAETSLTPAVVNSTQFGLLFTDDIDGAAYAEPLYVPNVAIPNQGSHNVVYVATENDSVYAFDADAAGPPLWHVSFIDRAKGITPVPASDLQCGDLFPMVGITATPVIDPLAGTLYVLSKAKLGPGNYLQQLHALDITTGLERPHSPVTIAASVQGTADDSVDGTISFNPLLQHARPALTLANGIVYLSFASHCDIGPFHGWILGYDQTTLSQQIVYNTTPNGEDGGIWESGCGPGVDTNGDLILITGNGTFDTIPPTVNYGDSFLRLTPGGGTLSVTTSFTPINETFLNDEDLDLGSGGNLLLPDQPGPNTHLMVGGGKLGTIYLINRDSMGGFNGTDQVVQELPSEIDSWFGTAAYWQGMVPGVGLQNMIYTIGSGDHPRMYVLSNGLIQKPAASIASAYQIMFPGASPVISANGTTGGIMWAIDSSRYNQSGPATLYAFDATNLAHELYDSNQVGSDNPGPAVKFTVPTVANAFVYVGTQTRLAAFGLLPAARPTPTVSATATTSPSPDATVSATATMTSTAFVTATPTTTSTAIITATPAATVTATPPTTTTPTATIVSTPAPTPTIAATPTTTPSATPTPVFATLNASPTSISFSNQVVGRQGKTAKVTVINTAARASVTMGQPTLSTGFAMASNNCPAVLAPGGSCTIELAFAPTSKGKKTGQLQLNSNAPYGLHTVKLKGKGLAPKMITHPKSLTFGPIAIEAVSSSQSVTVVNNSPAPITFTTAPAATPPFNVSANTCDTLAPNGGTCTISVEFAPHKRGKYLGTLELQDDAANSPQHIRLVGTSK